jgi:hypothetical protein
MTKLDQQDDTRTATAALRDLLAETEGRRRNGPASDGRGWYRTEADRADCYAVADNLLPLFKTEWVYGVPWDPAKPNAVHECDDQDHAREWRRDLHWEGPIVRQLTVRLASAAWEPAPETSRP